MEGTEISDNASNRDKAIRIQSLARGFLARRRKTKEGDKIVKPVFVPTSAKACATFIEMIKLKEDDILLDLGCGDGRVLIQSALSSGCRAIGVELDEKLCERAKIQVSEQKATTVEIYCTDVTNIECESWISSASVVFLFMLPVMNERMRDVLFKCMPEHSRVVTWTFRIRDWPVHESKQTDEYNTLFVYSMDEVRKQMTLET